MWYGSEKGISPRKRRQNLELGITPLIDIVFLLLIFFMLTSRFVAQEGIKIDLPRTKIEHTLPSTEDFVVYIKQDGSFYFQGKVYSFSDLQGELIRQRAIMLQKPVEIRSDRWAPVQPMVEVLELLRGLGAGKVTIGTIQEPSNAFP